MGSGTEVLESAEAQPDTSSARILAIANVCCVTFRAQKVSLWSLSPTLSARSDFVASPSTSLLCTSPAVSEFLTNSQSESPTDPLVEFSHKAARSSRASRVLRSSQGSTVAEPTPTADKFNDAASCPQAMDFEHVLGRFCENGCFSADLVGSE